MLSVITLTKKEEKSAKHGECERKKDKQSVIQIDERNLSGNKIILGKQKETFLYFTSIPRHAKYHRVLNLNDPEKESF